MGQKSPCPAIPKTLMDWLDATYPERCPLLDTPDRKIWMDAGARSVVRRLRQEFDKQTTSSPLSTP